VGIVANQPTELAGCLDINSSTKARPALRDQLFFSSALPFALPVRVPSIPIAAAM
jgi:hypothetical protein